MTIRNRKPYIIATTGLVIVALSDMAVAQSSSLSSSSQPVNNAAATQLITTTTISQMLTISNAISARVLSTGGPVTMAGSGQSYGMAAGAMGNKVNVWGNISDDSNKYSSGANRFNAKATTATFGADYALTQTISAGVSAAFDRGTGDRGVNSNYTAGGYTLAPYASWLINKEFSLDAIAGWGKGTLDSANSVTSDSTRFFYGTNLNYVRWVGDLQYSGKLSYLHGEEKYGDTKTAGTTNANTATKNKIDQWRLGAQVGYWMNGFLPFVGASYVSDSRSVSNLGGATDPTADLGKTAWLATAGVNLISTKNNLTGGIVFNTEMGRSHSKRDTIMANINYRF